MDYIEYLRSQKVPFMVSHWILNCRVKPCYNADTSISACTIRHHLLALRRQKAEVFRRDIVCFTCLTKGGTGQVTTPEVMH